MTFGFIRHPVSFLESLWSHRKKKKNYDKNIFNWQDHLRLERECGSENFEEFILNEPQLLNVETSVSNYAGFGVSCSGASDGFINLTVSEGA